jgi:hypothetical protein
MFGADPRDLLLKSGIRIQIWIRIRRHFLPLYYAGYEFNTGNELFAGIKDMHRNLCRQSRQPVFRHEDKNAMIEVERHRIMKKP